MTPNDEPAAGSLLDLLGYAPDRLADDSLPLSDIVQYADIARWLQQQGIEVPTSPSDPSWDQWQTSLDALAIPDILASRGAETIWMDTYGFSLQQIDQVLAVGSAPDYVLILRGRFDESTLLAAWADSGYQAVRVEGVTYWSLNPGGSVDLSAPASRPALGNLNNIVLLDDGTIIATSHSARMEQTIRTVQGDQPSMAENNDIQGLLAPGVQPQNLIIAMILKGSVLELPSDTPSASLESTPVVPLPESDLLLVGLIPGPTATAPPRFAIVARYGSAADATSAQARATQELASATSPVTGQPYRDRVTPVNMLVLATTDDDSLLVIHLDMVAGVDDWRAITEERDFGYLMWPREP